MKQITFYLFLFCVVSSRGEDIQFCNLLLDRSLDPHEIIATIKKANEKDVCRDENKKCFEIILENDSLYEYIFLPVKKCPWLNKRFLEIRGWENVGIKTSIMNCLLNQIAIYGDYDYIVMLKKLLDKESRYAFLAAEAIFLISRSEVQYVAQNKTIKTFDPIYENGLYKKNKHYEVRFLKEFDGEVLKEFNEKDITVSQPVGPLIFEERGQALNIEIDN